MAADCQPDALAAFAGHAHELHRLAQMPEVADLLGPSLCREFQYALAAYRSRFPDTFIAAGDAQPDDNTPDPSEH